MPRLAALLLSLGCLVALLAAAPAGAQAPQGHAPVAQPPPAPAIDDGVPAPVAGREADSDAPPGSPPHWLPHDMWVHLHWVPFDEARLQSLLHTSRAGLWRWLRDDTQTLAQLGARRGYASPKALAAALVAPRAGDVSAAMLRELRARTLRVLVQGHLSQHLIFHSLHQEAGPEAAAKLFGVRDTEAFQALRRMDLSPLRIGRQHGRTRAQMQGGLERELRAAAREGVQRGDTSPRQARIVLARQLRQIPRWLGEDHYNGPPQTVGGKLRYPFRPSFASPALSGDGRTVLFDAQQPAPPLAVRFGEVVLEGLDLAGAVQIDPRDASRDALLDRPCSSYGPSLSGDGRRIAYEISAGNRTYAKRYGNVVVAVADLAAKTVRVVAGRTRGSLVETAYDPALSSDGEVVAYQSVIADPMSPSTRAATRVRVVDLRAGTSVTVPRAGAYEPAISGDGRRVAFSAFSVDGRARRLQVYVYDRRTKRTTLVSRIGRRGAAAAEAWDPAISGDGGRVAFAATTRAGGRARVYVRDLRRATSMAASSPGAGFASEPSLSEQGQRVAYSELARGGRRSAAGRPLQRIVMRNLASGRVWVVSADAGRAEPESTDPRGESPPPITDQRRSAAFEGVHPTGAPPIDPGPRRQQGFIHDYRWIQAELGGWSGQPQISAYGTRIAFTTDAGTPAGGGPGGLRVLVRDLAAATTTIANPAAPLGSFQTGAGALQPAGRLCSLAPPAW